MNSQQTFPSLTLDTSNELSAININGDIDQRTQEISRFAVKSIYQTAFNLNPNWNDINLPITKDNIVVLVKNALIHALYYDNPEDANARMWRELDIRDLFEKIIEKAISVDRITEYLTELLPVEERWNGSDLFVENNNKAIGRVLFHLAQTFDALLIENGDRAIKDATNNRDDYIFNLRKGSKVKFIEEFDYSHNYVNFMGRTMTTSSDRFITGEVASINYVDQKVNIFFTKDNEMRAVSFDDFYERGQVLNDANEQIDLDTDFLEDINHPDHDKYTEVFKNNIDNLIVPNLIRFVTDESNAEQIGDSTAYRSQIAYPNKKGTGTESHTIETESYPAFDWIMSELQGRIIEISSNIKLEDRPEKQPAREIWELENIIAPLNELMMIFNSRIAETLPGKLSEALINPAIAEDWDLIKKVLGFSNKQTFTDFIFEKVSRKYLFKMLDSLALALEAKGKEDIMHAVKLGYQGVGKGAFSKTNKNVLRIMKEQDLLEATSSNADLNELIQFLTNTFALNIGETGTGTGRIAVPNDGDPQFAYAAPTARGTLAALVKAGGMINDSYMNVMVVFEMIKMVLLGYDGADVDTLPRTPGQLKDMNEIIIPYLKENHNVDYRTMYQIYEMSDAKTAELIQNNRNEAAVASKALSIQIGKLSNEKGYTDAFPHAALVASLSVGKEKVTELESSHKPILTEFYEAKAHQIRKHLLNDDLISSIFPADLPKREIIIQIYIAHVQGFTKIIEQRVAGRLIKEQREDDNIIYSLLNRVRSTEGTYADFINGVAEEIIPVDGTPTEAWTMFIVARIKASNPELYDKITGGQDADLTSLWEKVVEIGTSEHEKTINPVEA